ncbi:MAG: deoxyguanosinetriphosphate triphosphohydrolase [Actinobacteria bacterium RBG_16_68_21]|nr:MAG: deoxyguanosinetriphosphate triphosphohydrolase [Actinobacteria bacterium RBG_16_68_21]
MEPRDLFARALIRRTRPEAERREHDLLSPAATRSTTSRGRNLPEAPDPFRTAFERDRDRILHSKAFRRLKHKTQVFINPDGDHYVTRLTHTLQVTQIGRSLAVTLGLNESLTEAICLGHDVGHSPFGHIGESALTPYVVGEWHHAAQSVRVFEVLEPLNLTWEVRDGIRGHSWKIDPPPATPEGMVCRFADRIAYLTHDVDDAVRAGVIQYRDLPGEAIDAFGEPGSAWIGSMIEAVAAASVRRGEVTMDPGHLDAMNVLRDFMFARVYLRPDVDDQRDEVIAIVRYLVDHYVTHPDQVPDSYRHHGADAATAAIDYVSGMTDRFAIREHQRLTGS